MLKVGSGERAYAILEVRRVCLAEVGVPWLPDPAPRVLVAEGESLLACFASFVDESESGPVPRSLPVDKLRKPVFDLAVDGEVDVTECVGDEFVAPARESVPSDNRFR